MRDYVRVNIWYKAITIKHHIFNIVKVQIWYRMITVKHHIRNFIRVKIWHRMITVKHHIRNFVRVMIWHKMITVGHYIRHFPYYSKALWRRIMFHYTAPGESYANKGHFFYLKNHWSRHYQMQISLAENVLESHDADLLILGKDCVYYSTACWVRAAKNIGVKTALIPFDEASSDTLAEHRFDHKEHLILSEADEEIAAQHPEWVYEYKEQRLLLLSSPQIAALNELNISPANPWAYNSSNCDRILLDSEFQKSKYTQTNAVDQQLAVTGAVYQDLLAASYKNAKLKRKELLDSFGWKDDKLLILGSLTPNKLSERDVELEFSDYFEMLSYWTKCLIKDNRFNVILCLHPSVNYSEVSFLENYGVKIIREDTATLIGVCDVYVVDCSATSRWALAAGKLVIDYDLLRYGLDFHSSLDGIIHIQSKKDFESVLDKLANGELEPERAIVKSRADAGFWGEFDGRASSRINEECLRLISDHNL